MQKSPAAELTGTEGEGGSTRYVRLTQAAINHRLCSPASKDALKPLEHMPAVDTRKVRLAQCVSRPEFDSVRSCMAPSTPVRGFVSAVSCSHSRAYAALLRNAQ